MASAAWELPWNLLGENQGVWFPSIRFAVYARRCKRVNKFFYFCFSSLFISRLSLLLIYCFLFCFPSFVCFVDISSNFFTRNWRTTSQKTYRLRAFNIIKMMHGAHDHFPVASNPFWQLMFLRYRPYSGQRTRRSKSIIRNRVTKTKNRKSEGQILYFRLNLYEISSFLANLFILKQL